MNKIALIIAREYKSKVQKKSFWIIAILGPLLFALGMIVPMWLGMQQEDKMAIEVVDRSGIIVDRLISSPEILFVPNSQKKQPKNVSAIYKAVLVIPANVLEHPEGIEIYSHSKLAPDVKIYIENNLNEIVSSERLKRSGIERQVIEKSYVHINLQNKKLDKDWNGEVKTTAALVVGLFSAVLVMFFIVLYGGQVMRGVMEEKMNRIVEVMISSVSPFQLMMGKIVGIALVSLTQFLIWICLSYGLTYFVQSRYEKAIDAFSDQNIEATLKNNPQVDAVQAVEINKIMNAIDSLDIILMLSVFMIYFIFGYLLYAAIFAGIGSLVDSETDTQQYVFPLIAPLMFVMFFATNLMENPDGDLAFWLSMIPFTSPVSMMLRIPFGVSTIQLVTSIFLLIICFVAFTWLSARVYRLGILLYGKKASLSEVYRWMLK